MNNDSSVSQQLLAALGQHLKTDLQPDNGVCALFNSQNQEMCVIEFSPHNSHALLHCAIGGALHAPDRYRELLKLNFQPDKLLGCWLALDENDELRICAQCPVAFLTEEIFCQWVTGFIQQLSDTRLLLCRPD